MIQKYRKELDSIDNEVTKLLLERLELVKKIGEEKKNQNIAVLDKSREDSIKVRLSSLCNSDIEINYVLNIYDSIMNESKRVQK